MTEAATRRAPGTPCWVSLMVHGLGTTEEFYGALFGWEYAPGPGALGPYVRALVDGLEVAGIGQLPPDRHLPVTWTTYLATDDADETAEAVRSCGGTLAVGPLDAADAGRLAICADPGGAVFGIWQAGSHIGTRLTGVPGTPVWNELFTRETSLVEKFYQTVFGHRAEARGDSTGVDRLTLHLSGRPVAAVHGVGRDLPKDRGAHWMTHFQVADTDRAAALVADLGGTVLRPPRDEPHARTAVVRDPEGAVFTITRPHA
ncbi:VOC family protein [Streptomyces sp. NPDC012888]|uniref:VOC family protein n=1 Tax=Streptomyces sp. NPDC012888 TaxID=3364855 RepID=UPI0036A9A341